MLEEHSALQNIAAKAATTKPSTLKALYGLRALVA